MMDRIIAVRNQKTIYRDGSKCIKVFNEDYSKADILSEALHQACAEQTGLHVPRILEVTTMDGKWAIVSEYIKGKTLSQKMQETPQEIEKYFTMYVDLQLKVHAQKCPLLPKLSDKLNRNISLMETDEALRCELKNRLAAMPEHTRLCHGDFNPSNIIIAENGAPYILDWSHAAQGDPAADAACAYLLFCLNGDSEGAQRYLELFCRKSGTSKASVQGWMPIVAAARSVKGNAGERDVLLSWLNAVDCH